MIFDFLFPPICPCCGEKSQTKILCSSCWLLCEPPDPAVRCRHCFLELEKEEKCCHQCRIQRRHSAQRAFVFDPESPASLLGLDALDALAGFALIQFIQLEWDMPDAIIPMPDSISIAAAFADLLHLPLIQALDLRHSYKEDRLEENGTLLLFDISNSIPVLQKSTMALMESFPKRIYLLSLFPNADCHP